MSTSRKPRSGKKVGSSYQGMATSSDPRKTRKVIEFTRKLPPGDVTEDQRLAAAVTIKIHPKSKMSELNKIRRALRSLGPL